FWIADNTEPTTTTGGERPTRALRDFLHRFSVLRHPPSVESSMPWYRGITARICCIRAISSLVPARSEIFVGRAVPIKCDSARTLCSIRKKQVKETALHASTAL